MRCRPRRQLHSRRFSCIAVVSTPRMAEFWWTLIYEHHDDRTATHGYEATREAAMAAIAKSWWRE
jgi:hypothetical protein